MTLSVLVPVYNMSKYLAECLDSILAQRIEDMEIICLNDGSTDESLNVLKQYEDNDSRISIIDKQNTGYGDTLNIGIERACGEYIAFVESDDLVVEGAFQALLQKAKETDADVIKGNYYNYIHGTLEYYDNLKGLREGEYFEGENKDQLFFIAPSIWTGFYKKSFLDEEHIRFLPTPGASYQDTSFAFKIWACAKKVVVMHIPVIQYRNDNPTSSSNETGKPFHILAEYEEIAAFLEKKGKTGLYPIFSKVRYISATWNAHRLVQELKLPFLIKIREIFKDDQEKGYVIKKYWNDEDWRLVHMLIYNFRGYCEELGLSWRGYDIENLAGFLRNTHPLYIYGTDTNSRAVLMFLKCYRIEVEALIETEYLPKSRELDDKPVVTIDQVKPEGIIVLGIGEKKETGRAILNGHGLYNYIDVDLNYQTTDAIRSAYRLSESYYPEIQELRRENVEFRKQNIDLGGINDRLERYKRVAIKLMDTSNTLVDWLASKGFYNVSVYGIGRLGKALVSKIINTDIHIEMLVDRNEGEFCGFPIQNVDYFEKNFGETKVIIITPLYEAKKIGQTIADACGIKWISIEDLLEY